MSTHKLIVLPENRVLFAPNGASVADVLREYRIPIDFQCRQRGLCGKCLIEIVEGAAGSADAAERAVLDRQHRPRNYRLACRVDVRGPLSIRIAPEARMATVRPFRSNQIFE